jgi:uncharacterized RDD family membrane protein YckC
VTDQAPPSAPPSPPEPAWTGTPAPQASTRPGPMPGWHYAGFWVRFLAILLDAILLGIVTAALAPVWGPQVTVTNTGTIAAIQVNAQANAISTLLGLVYFTGMWAWRGQTVGMMPFNMQVVGVADGKKIDVFRGLLRYVGFIISIIPIFIGLIWAAFDARKQGWHDKIASTVVIRPN